MKWCSIKKNTVTTLPLPYSPLWCGVH